MIKIWSVLNVMYYVIITVIQPNDVQSILQKKRFKRILSIDGAVQISPAEHKEKYPYIVEIKTIQRKTDGRSGKRVLRCTGTLLSPSMVLTTDYCVRNALSITVYQIYNIPSKYRNPSWVFISFFF